MISLVNKKVPWEEVRFGGFDEGDFFDRWLFEDVSGVLIDGSILRLRWDSIKDQDQTKLFDDKCHFLINTTFYLSRWRFSKIMVTFLKIKIFSISFLWSIPIIFSLTLFTFLSQCTFRPHPLSLIKKLKLTF